MKIREIDKVTDMPIITDIASVMREEILKLWKYYDNFLSQPFSHPELLTILSENLKCTVMEDKPKENVNELCSNTSLEKIKIAFDDELIRKGEKAMQLLVINDINEFCQDFDQKTAGCDLLSLEPMREESQKYRFFRHGSN